MHNYACFCSTGKPTCSHTTKFLARRWFSARRIVVVLMVIDRHRFLAIHRRFANFKIQSLGRLATRDQLHRVTIQTTHVAEITANIVRSVCVASLGRNHCNSKGHLVIAFVLFDLWLYARQVPHHCRSSRLPTCSKSRRLQSLPHLHWNHFFWQ